MNYLTPRRLRKRERARLRRLVIASPTPHADYLPPIKTPSAPAPLTRGEQFNRWVASWLLPRLARLVAWLREN